MSRQKVRSERSTPSIFWLLAVLILPPLRLLMKQRISGAEHLPKTGPFILVPNHYSAIDPLVIAAALWKSGRIPRFMAKASLFRKPVLGAVMRATGQIPVERGGSSRDHDPVALAETLINGGKGVIVYPEGTLTRDPGLWPMRGKSGAARLALAQRGLPIIPVAHWGTQRVLPRYGKLSVFPPKRVDVRFGPPIDIDAFRDEPANSVTFAAATDQIMTSITSLLEDLRGEKAPVERWNPSDHDQKETGRFDS